MSHDTLFHCAEALGYLFVSRAAAICNRNEIRRFLCLNHTKYCIVIMQVSPGRARRCSSIWKIPRSTSLVQRWSSLVWRRRMNVPILFRTLSSRNECRALHLPSKYFLWSCVATNVGISNVFRITFSKSANLPHLGWTGVFCVWRDVVCC